MVASFFAAFHPFWSAGQKGWGDAIAFVELVAVHIQL
jgi:hypothetical protein